MSTHTWKPGTSGFILDPSNYADGAAFLEGDTLVVDGGTPNAAANKSGLVALTTGTYLFDVGGAGAGLQLQDIALRPMTQLIESGAGTLQMLTFGTFVNGGILSIGTTAAAGSTQISMDAASDNAASLVNSGQWAVQNHSRLKIYPSSASTIQNQAGASMTVSDDSQLFFSDFYGYSAITGNALQNDGTIEVSGRSSLTVAATYSGAGTLLLQGDPGADPAANAADIEGPATGTFNIRSSELDFSGGNPVQGAINFYDGGGLLNLEQDPVSQSTAVFKPLLASVNHFQAGDQILLNGFAASKSYDYDPATHVLSLFAGAGEQGDVVAQITLPGLYSTSDFTVANGASADGIAPDSAFTALISTSSTANGSFSLAPGDNFVGGNGNALIATQGSATITTGAGDNSVYLSDGAHLVVSNGQDSIVASSGGDTVFGANAGLVQGGSGNLEFIGRGGLNTVTGGTGALTVFGASGGGVYQAGSTGGSVLIATAGNTTLTGAANGDAMFGGAAAGDVLQAGNQAGTGFDYLVAGSGTATLQNGLGNTVMYAGAGPDLFSISAADAGTDWVIGFKQGADHVALGGADAANVLRTATFSASGTTFMVGGSQVTVWNTRLAPSDFA